MLPGSTCTPCFSIFGYECWGYHLHLGENCVLCFPGILFRGTLVLSFNQENRLVVFLFIELLTVSLVNTGSWIIVSKAQQMTSFFSRNKTFLDNFIMYNRSLGFFSLCSSKLLVREKEKNKEKMCLKSTSVNSLWQGWRKIL